MSSSFSANPPARQRIGDMSCSITLIVLIRAKMATVRPAKGEEKDDENMRTWVTVISKMCLRRIQSVPISVPFKRNLIKTLKVRPM